ncbi:3-oxoacyl-[acyl-carrier-protein] synthase III C-terminal domain-containing protein [Flavobacterium sp. RSB2_4_14]|uniref:3-oxoacyl-[acyl-carrier-protein] synthase III C-terminal domain-containing protein n=1 Tax=Flavobacterium sp. RSB2_4_14 TaxID=3447665 RepID=UPI003F2FAF04
MSFYHFNNVKIAGMASAVPHNKCSIEQLLPAFDANKVKDYGDKFGFHPVRQSVDLQTASDLGFAAASQLLESKNTNRDEIGFIIFLTKTPDYRSPASAIVLQHRLQLPIDCLAYDVNLGAIGFIAGLQLGCSLLNGLNTSKGLVIIGDTNSKQTDPADLFSKHLGDAATALLLEKQDGMSSISTQVFSQGNGYDSYIIPGGAFRTKMDRSNYELSSVPSATDFNKLIYDWNRMHTFFSETIPAGILGFMKETKSQVSEYDVIAFQQSNNDTNKKITNTLGMERNIVPSIFNSFGDVSGSSIPLLLAQTKIETGSKRVLSCAYGEGYSWGFADFFIDKNTVLPSIETDDYFTEGTITHEI